MGECESVGAVRPGTHRADRVGRGSVVRAGDGGWHGLPSWGSAIRQVCGGLHRRPALQRIRGSIGFGIVVGG
ncbi:MAG: hypothetical protein KDE31_03290, partial [Caldilineaceae bacterium]|nr:hypothetical protein [Caldilineaceae bacterium]